MVQAERSSDNGSAEIIRYPFNERRLMTEFNNRQQAARQTRVQLMDQLDSNYRFIIANTDESGELTETIRNFLTKQGISFGQEGRGRGRRRGSAAMAGLSDPFSPCLKHIYYPGVAAGAMDSTIRSNISVKAALCQGSFVMTTGPKDFIEKFGEGRQAVALDNWRDIREAATYYNQSVMDFMKKAESESEDAEGQVIPAVGWEKALATWRTDVARDEAQTGLKAAEENAAVAGAREHAETRREQYLREFSADYEGEEEEPLTISSPPAIGEVLEVMHLAEENLVHRPKRRVELAVSDVIARELFTVPGERGAQVELASCFLRVHVEDGNKVIVDWMLPGEEVSASAPPRRRRPQPKT